MQKGFGFAVQIRVSDLQHGHVGGYEKSFTCFPSHISFQGFFKVFHELLSHKFKIACSSWTLNPTGLLMDILRSHRIRKYDVVLPWVHWYSVLNARVMFFSFFFIHSYIQIAYLKRKKGKKIQLQREKRIE